jgi:hypothetical protein
MPAIVGSTADDWSRSTFRGDDSSSWDDTRVEIPFSYARSDGSGIRSGRPFVIEFG